jgi:hypothetical protein
MLAIFVALAAAVYAAASSVSAPVKTSLALSDPAFGYGDVDPSIASPGPDSTKGYGAP